MDLNTIQVVVQPPDRASIPAAAAGDAFLAGGTWLFSEPQTDLRRLVDLTSLGWRPLTATADGLDIAATCTLTEFEDSALPAAWPAASLIAPCCRALFGSFKIRSAATVGGNLCLALPASPMAALLSALDGVCSIWTPDGGERRLPVIDLVVGPSRNALHAGEILRAIHVPAHALARTASFRQMSLTPLGRSAALLIGTRSHAEITLTISASVARPMQLSFANVPDPALLARRIDEAIRLWYDDVHGAPMWRKRITHIMAADIIAELAAP